eukprot:m.148546 g.148546  ORF g.148546 m.148546 type:complete len:99 (+) comp15000_c0_seq5:255-551(+)
MMAAASDNLECKIGCHEGLDVGNGVDRFGLRYTYQGNVYNNRAHGVGVLTYEDGDQYLGPFEHGTISGGIAFYHSMYCCCCCFSCSSLVIICVSCIVQ